MRYFYYLFLFLFVPQYSLLNAQPQLDTAYSYVGLKEATGHNDGYHIEKFLKLVGRKKGDSWCAAFVSYCLEVNNIREPSIRSGLARDFTKSKYVIDAKNVYLDLVKVNSGDLVVWKKGNSIYGHIGFVINWNQTKGTTIEGNTSSGQKGSQSDGDGVYIRNRKIEPMNYFRITWFVRVIE